MYTSFIGKKFLRRYNDRLKKQLTAKQFFDEEIYPVFFKDEPHLLHVGNSPFFQKIAVKDMANGKTAAETQLEKLHEGVANKQPNGSIFVGYAAEDLKATTSGQITNLDAKIDAEEIYASWIGEALGVGVEGGIYLLFDRDDLLDKIFEGWKIYRKYLLQTPGVKGRQIETWNGHWLAQRLDEGIEAFTPPKPEKGTEGKELAIKGLSWTLLIFKLSQRYPSISLTVYAYTLGQTNVTLGFVNLKLHEVTRLWEYNKLIFGENENLRKMEALYEPLYSFRWACRISAVIGLKALEPKKMREYFAQPNEENNKTYKINSEESLFYFKLYKLWIIAMLNKKELLDLASKAADCLIALEQKDNQRGKTVNVNIAEGVRNARNAREFIEKLEEVMKKEPAYANTLRNVVLEALTMPHDNFPLFVALLRFEHTYKKTAPIQPTLL